MEECFEEMEEGKGKRRERVNIDTDKAKKATKKISQMVK